VDPGGSDEPITICHSGGERRLAMNKDVTLYYRGEPPMRGY
jgi:hypothetical protein